MKVELRLTSVRKFSRIIRFFLPLLMAMAFFSITANAQTVDEVIAKNIQAKGGADKLKSVRSLRTTAKFSQGSFRADFRQENKRADKVHEERRRALLLSGCGLVPGAETGNPNHDSWRAAGERTVFRRLRASERHLLSVCGRAGAEGQCFARADLGREDRTKYSAGRHAFLYAGVQTRDEGATGWEVTIEKE